jgi:hypothetical protein
VRSFSDGRLRSESDHRQNQRRFLPGRELMRVDGCFRSSKE